MTSSYNNCDNESNAQLKLLLMALEDPKQKAMGGPLEGSHGLVGKALEPYPSKDTSPDEPRLGSCKA